MNQTDSAPARPRAPIAVLTVVSLAVAVVLGLVVWAGAWGGTPQFHGTAYEPPAEAPDFALTEHTGRTVRLGDHRGKAVLLFFGFTHCPDVCPLTLTRLSRVLGEMDADSSRVRVLLVTVDPARDSPEALARYVAGFGPHVSGLTGDSATLAGVRAAYHVYAGQHAGPNGHVTVSHTTQVFGIDRHGQLRVLISPELGDEVVRDDLRTLLSL